ncbi:LOW QUALITY PROTEIN: DNA (cytosine-5)-methyltransferase 3-like [Liasis olivaceus]
MPILGTYNYDLEISTSSVEEVSTFKLSEENIAQEVKYNERYIEDICLCCGVLEIHTQRSLFHGGMCAPCSERFLERFFLCGDDGYQADCTICLGQHDGSNNVDDSACHRCFCEECVDILVYPGHAEEIEETSPWICLMCAPQGVNGLLKRRTKWCADLKHFYDQESNSPNIWIYQPLSPWERKSIRVLLLFDNITEELKTLGFLGERRGNGYLKYVDDVTGVVRIHVKEWGPFDFIFGSTPPAAIFYKHPSVWYFYQFFHILQYGSSEDKSKKPFFFWLFVDNTVLDKAERDAASRFSQMEAVPRYKQDDGNVQNAVYMWSNSPSVNSKYSASALHMDLSILAKNICRSRIFSQHSAMLIRDFFVPLKEYFRAFS